MASQRGCSPATLGYSYRFGWGLFGWGFDGGLINVHWMASQILPCVQAHLLHPLCQTSPSCEAGRQFWQHFAPLLLHPCPQPTGSLRGDGLLLLLCGNRKTNLNVGEDFPPVTVTHMVRPQTHPVSLLPLFSPAPFTLTCVF